MEIKNKITDEYKVYYEKYGKHLDGSDYLDNNSIESRLSQVITLSIPFYAIEGIAVGFIGSHMGSSFPIPNTILPGIIIGSSLISGAIFKKVLYMKDNTEKNTKTLSDAESVKEFELELAEEKLEAIKMCHRALCFADTFPSESYKDKYASKEEMLKRYEELKVIISNKLHDLDTEVTKTYLIDLRDTYTHPIHDYVGIPISMAVTLMIVSAAPLFGGSQPVSLLPNLIIPLAIGEVCGLAYQIDKAIRRNDVFKAINTSLGRDAITKEELKEIKKAIKLAKDKNLLKSFSGYPQEERRSIEKAIEKLVDEAKYIENVIENDDWQEPEKFEPEKVEPQMAYTEEVYYTTDNNKAASLGLHINNKKTNH